MSLFNELKRRKVFRVGIAYVVIAWLTAQVLQLVFESFIAPDWVMKTVLVLLAAGLPIALFFAWAFELTPEGLKKEQDVDRLESATQVSGRKLEVVIIGVIAIVIAYFLVDKFALVGDDAPKGETVTEDKRSIAVLPFVNMSADEENEYFADGLSEEILNRLAQLPELHVTGRTSSFSFKDRNEDLRSIGEFLGVAHILEGSVRRQANQVRVTAQLIRAQDGFHLWSNTFDVELDDVFAVQDQIAENVAEALDVLLSEQARKRMQDAGIRDVEAFVAYQRGVDLYHRAHEVEGTERIDRLAEANRYFDDAIARAAGFSAAYFLKSDYFAHLAFLQESSLEQQRSAVESATAELEKASQTASDPKLRAMIEVDVALYGDDWTRLRLSMEEAARLPGCRTPNWLPNFAAFFPTLIEKITTDWRACEPLTGTADAESAPPAMYLGRADEALALIDQGIRKVGPQVFFRIYRTKVLIALGRFDEARIQAESIKSQSSRTDALEILILGAEGKPELAKQRAEHWFAKHPEELRHESSESVALLIAAATGQRQLANQLASELDGLPAGTMSLTLTVHGCFCGAPFDIEFTPNFRARIQEAGLSWPPSSPIKYPAKSW